MHADPTRNVVVFQFGQADGTGAPSGHHDGSAATATGEAPTVADDCVRQAWESVRREHHARADQVTALYSEWEPSAEDLRFVRETFPTAAMSYSFRRPHPADWEQALDDARQVMAEAAMRHEAERLTAQGEDAEAVGELLPLLWSSDAPHAEMLDMLPHRRLVAGRLYVAMAMVAPTAHGTLGMSHLTHATQRDLDFTLDDLLGLAFENVRTGLTMEGQSSDEGDLMIMHREGGSLCAAAVALPDFHERVSGILGGAERLIVGIPDQCHLYVADAAAPMAEHVERSIRAVEPHDAELTPVLLSVTAGEIRLW
ncbi:MAG TPA: hypothetical protein VGD67_02040 [Pseudonocardiaceae bacterium]